MSSVSSCLYSFGQSAFAKIPTKEKIFNGLCGTIKNMAKNVQKVAIPVFVLYCASNMPQAEAGPVAYGACLTACLAAGAIATGPAMCCLACCCAEACTPLLVAPTP